MWEFFDDIICINLKSRPDRKLYVESIFKKYNIPGRIISVDKHPDGGFTGCFDSHINIIKDLYYKTNKDNVLIFEDDILPTLSFNEENMKKTISFMKNNNNWDLFYFGYFTLNFTQFYTNAYQLDENIIQYNPFATHAYCINRRAMPKILLNYQDYIGKKHYDIYLAHFCNLKNYCYIPMLFEQYLCFDSDIKPKNLPEYIVRKNQCFIQKSHFLWFLSLYKYFIFKYIFIIFIIIILIIIIKKI